MFMIRFFFSSFASHFSPSKLGDNNFSYFPLKWLRWIYVCVCVCILSFIFPFRFDVNTLTMYGISIRFRECCHSLCKWHENCVYFNVDVCVCVCLVFFDKYSRACMLSIHGNNRVTKRFWSHLIACSRSLSLFTLSHVAYTVGNSNFCKARLHAPPAKRQTNRCFIAVSSEISKCDESERAREMKRKSETYARTEMTGYAVEGRVEDKYHSASNAPDFDSTNFQLNRNILCFDEDRLRHSIKRRYTLLHRVLCIHQWSEFLWASSSHEIGNFTTDTPFHWSFSLFFVGVSAV